MAGKPRSAGTTTKRDLARAIAKGNSCTAALTLMMVDALFTELREQLIQGNRVEVRGFGVLSVKDTKPKPLSNITLCRYRSLYPKANFGVKIYTLPPIDILIECGHYA